MEKNLTYRKAITILAALLIAMIACGNPPRSGEPAKAPQLESSPTEIGEDEQSDGETFQNEELEEELDIEALARKPFLMPIADIETITGRGLLVSGTVERGILEPNSEVEILGGSESVMTYLVTSISQNSKTIEQAFPREYVNLLLRGASREDLHVGQVVAVPGSVAVATDFSADIRMLPEDEGGRNKAYSSGYRPQLQIRTFVVTAQIILPEDIEFLLPGDEQSVTISLIASAALEVGTTFLILEDDFIIGTGVVTTILD